MTTQLAFHKTTFTPICHNNRIWLTATEVGLALEYTDDKAVQRIYSRHSDEFYRYDDKGGQSDHPSWNAGVSSI